VTTTWRVASTAKTRARQLADPPLRVSQLVNPLIVDVVQLRLPKFRQAWPPRVRKFAHPLGHANAGAVFKMQRCVLSGRVGQVSYPQRGQSGVLQLKQASIERVCQLAQARCSENPPEIEIEKPRFSAVSVARNQVFSNHCFSEQDSRR
jgi:hypothetical protein